VALLGALGGSLECKSADGLAAGGGKFAWASRAGKLELAGGLLGSLGSLLSALSGLFEWALLGWALSGLLGWALSGLLGWALLGSLFVAGGIAVESLELVKSELAESLATKVLLDLATVELHGKKLLVKDWLLASLLGTSFGRLCLHSCWALSAGFNVTSFDHFCL